MTVVACRICASLSPQDLLTLDSVIADPASWPKTIWGLMRPPEGGLPASYRWFGGEQMANAWLDDHDLEFSRKTIRGHIRHVAHVARDVDELVQLGIVVSTSAAHTKIPVGPAIDGGAFIRYFNSAIQAGDAAMRMVAERINRSIEAGEEPDMKLVLKLADMGAQFARTQASLVAKGAKFGQDEDEDAAFRGPADDLPVRLGKTSVRTIDGQRTAIKDEGPADRAVYNRRAAIEGGPQLD